MNASNSTWSIMLNVLALPGDVFDQVIAAPVNLANWRTPALLVCLASLINFYLRPNNGWGAGEPLAGSIVVIAATVIGSLWTASVLWLIGRFCLNVRFSAVKALEVAGLAGTVTALGQIATTLLLFAFGSHAHPSLELLASNFRFESGVRPILEIFNLFDLWSAAVLCIGLSKLARVSVKEASFWVFGYWVVLRLVLIAGT